MIESCCVLRAQLGIVVFLYVPAHRGIAMNAYADAVAKAHLGSSLYDAREDVCTRVTSRPMLSTIGSDFDSEGTLRPPGEKSAPRNILWDRRLFPAARRRLARWVHTELTKNLHEEYVDPVYIGRRAHESESKTYAAVARGVFKCAKLDPKEEDPKEGWRKTAPEYTWRRLLKTQRLAHAELKMNGLA